MYSQKIRYAKNISSFERFPFQIHDIQKMPLNYFHKIEFHKIVIIYVLQEFRQECMYCTIVYGNRKVKCPENTCAFGCTTPCGRLKKKGAYL
jgi:hypothetical protein